MTTINVTIPNWLDKICTWPVVLYRRCKYGYPFRRISLGEGQFTIVDPDVYYRFGHFKWCAGGNGSSFYAVRNAQTKPFLTEIMHLHRGIMNPPDGFVVDHINRNSLDNRRLNLRVVTQSENMQNRRKKANTSSRFVGVCFKKNECVWVAQIKKGKSLWLGRFHSEIEAARAYDRAAIKYYGEFSRLNFPRENYVSEICPS